jgi:hypothetical protein
VTLEELRDVLADVAFDAPDLPRFEPQLEGTNEVPLLRISWNTVCADSGRPVRVHTSLRPFEPSPGALLRQCLAAILEALEHEARERFRYQGRRIFGPHQSVEAMIAAADWPAPAAQS